MRPWWFAAVSAVGSTPTCFGHKSLIYTIMERKKSIYTSYRTNVPNILGGYMTYYTLLDALKSGAEHIWAVAKVRYDNNLGIDTEGYLLKVLWETKIK